MAAMLRILVRTLVFALALTATGLFAFVWIASSKLLVPNHRELEPRHRDLLGDPSRFGLELEAFETITRDHCRLAGWIATRAKRPGEARKTREMARRLGATLKEQSVPERTVVILHGRGGRKEDMLAIAERFVAANFRCILYDSRCHGASGGTVCTFGENEVADLGTVLDRVDSLLSSRGETMGSLSAFGISMGAAVTLQALPQQPRIRAAVAVAPFADFSEIVERSARRSIHPRTPPWLIASALQTAGFRGRFEPARIRPIDAVPKVDIPLLFVHGEQDGVIPAEHSRRLAAAAAGPATLRIVAGGTHGNVLATGGADLYEEMLRFLLHHS